MSVETKRAYEKASLSDGTRVLVDRLWPRGVTKKALKVEHWFKEIAPSSELRKWYHARPTQWEAFRKKYIEELHAPAALEQLEQLGELVASKKKVTLVYASKNDDRNNATVLRDLLTGMKKPPHSTGPAAAAAAGRARARARAPRR